MAAHRFDFGRLVTRWRWVLLGIGVVLGVAAIRPAQNLSMDRSIERMFAPGDPLLISLRRLKRTFGGNEVVLAVYEDPQLLSPDGKGIDRLSKVRATLERLEGVTGVFSLDRPIGRMIVTVDNSRIQRLREIFRGYTHSADGQTVALACMLAPAEGDWQQREQVIDGIRGAMQTLPASLPPGKITGEPVMLADGYEFVERDGRRLGLISTVLLSLTIGILFRSLRWVVIPLVVVQLAQVLTRALLAISQIQLTMVSSTLSAVITVIGIAAVVHVIVRLQQQGEEGLFGERAVERVARQLGAPIFWSCLTDAVGFAALATARVGPVRDFGIMMSVGSLMVLISCALMIPGLSLLGFRARGSGDASQAAERRSLQRLLERVIEMPARQRGWLTAILLSGFLLATCGILRLEVETDFTSNFRSDTPIVQAYELVESRLGGAGVCDVLIPAPERVDSAYLKRVLALEVQLRERVTTATASGDNVEPALTKVISLADVVSALAAKDFQTAPAGPVREALVRAALLQMQLQMPEFYSALYARDPETPDQQSFFRIMLRSWERREASEKLSILEQIQQISAAQFPAAEVTGYYVLMTNLVQSLLADQWRTFAVALTGIFAMIVLALRSVRLAVIAMVPNTLPILAVSGLMGWCGVRVNMGAAMITAVSIGLSIDSSIHYLTAYRRLRRDGISVTESLREVQGTVGRAVVFSTLALVVGFLAMCLSQFMPTVYFGVLVSMTMLGGLLGNIVVLPLLIRVVYRTG